MNRSLLCAAWLLAACQHRDNDVRPATPPPVAASAAPAEPAPAPPAQGDGISGRVVETMDAASYTYAKLDRGDKQIWVAGPQTKLAVGTKLDGLEGTLMTDFHSGTLDRTFAQIYFINSFGVAAASGGNAPVANHPPVPANHPPVPAAAEPAAAGDEVSGTVMETMDAAGYTYARLDRGGTKVWVAGPTTKLAVGTKLGRMTGTLMTGFRSKTLDRTFDQIYFVGGYTVDSGKRAN